MKFCGGVSSCGRWRYSIDRTSDLPSSGFRATNAKTLPSGDHRGIVWCGPGVSLTECRVRVFVSHRDESGAALQWRPASAISPYCCAWRVAKRYRVCAPRFSHARLGADAHRVRSVGTVRSAISKGHTPDKTHGPCLSGLARTRTATGCSRTAARCQLSPRPSSWPTPRLSVAWSHAVTACRSLRAQACWSVSPRLTG